MGTEPILHMEDRYYHRRSADIFFSLSKNRMICIKLEGVLVKNREVDLPCKEKSERIYLHSRLLIT